MRSAVNQAKNAYGQAVDVTNQKQSDANQIGSSLIPGLEREANNDQGYTPQEQNDQLVAAEQGLGGAAGGITEQANLESARTGNTAGYTSALGDAMREKGRLLSQESLGVKNRSADLGQENRRFAQGQLKGLYDTDTSGMLHSMGLQTEDINAEVNASKTGWLQNMNDTINALSGAATSAAGVKKAFG